MLPFAIRVGQSQYGRLLIAYDLSAGSANESEEYHDMVEIAGYIKNGLALKDKGIECGFESELSSNMLQDMTEQLVKSNTYLKYLNTNTIRDELISLMKLLKLKGITFYVDEWEKISYRPDLQRFMAFYIDRILDDPIYCWISVVPYRGSLYNLENGADLQHRIDLDENLIFENSKKDQELCINYFKSFIVVAQSD